jgi:vanillate O-demethylase monooxygenase subunit
MSSYLRNAWYMAAFSDEVTGTPMARTLLDTELVLYRKADGAPVMLRDRCPHRFAPLSLGSVIGDDLQCPYHGLRFDPTGACSHNPHMKGGGPLKAAAVQSFLVMEKYGALWFWPGDAGRADPGLLPEIAFLSRPERFSVIKGYLHVRGNYQLVVDNLLDLSHASYIHPQFAIAGVDAEEALAHTKVKLERHERSLTNYRIRSGLPAPTPAKAMFGFADEAIVHTKTHMTWHAPALLDFDVGTWEANTPEEEGALIPQLHVITPETEFTSHYFFLNGRNRHQGDPQVDAALLKLFDSAFRQQDEPMISAVQSRMGRVSDIHELHPILLPTDAAPVTARRILAKLIAAEQQPAAAPSHGKRAPLSTDAR